LSVAKDRIVDDLEVVEGLQEFSDILIHLDYACLS